MQSEADIKKVLEAANKADPDADNEDMRAIQDVLSWVLGSDGHTAESFIEYHIQDI